MPVADDPTLYATAAFSLGGIFAYALAKWRENTLNAARESQLKTAIDLARREANLEAAELKAEAESTQREALQLHASAVAEAHAANELAQTNHKQRNQLLLQLQQVSELSPEQAKTQLLSMLRREYSKEAEHLRRELLNQIDQDIADDARRTLLSAMQRLTTSTTQDATAISISLPNEDMKGRLIGREGRNIRTFEQTTGATLLIDDTPGHAMVSCFDPVRREIARIALERIVKDGRISPALIEESVRLSGEEVIQHARRLGYDAIRSLGLSPMDPHIVEHLGRLHFRLSANQNTLAHSIEVAQLCAILAAEIGIDPVPAKRAGLLHDIGKSIEAEAGSSHAMAGASLLRRFGEDLRVVNAVEAHHREVNAESLYAPLVMIADAASGARPGARSSTLESYTQRVRRLEEIALGFDGVREAFAFQSGRELRIIVDPGKVTDFTATELARQIRIKIEETLSYQGTVKIVLIREQKFTEEAR